MNRDANGIRWVSFTPVETEGVFLQNDGTYVPSVGAAQSFTVLNFQQEIVLEQELILLKQPHKILLR